MKTKKFTLVALVIVAVLAFNSQTANAKITKKTYRDGDTLVTFTNPNTFTFRKGQRMLDKPDLLARKTNFPLSTKMYSSYAVYYDEQTETQFYKLTNGKWIISRQFKFGYVLYVNDYGFGS